jgi:hypothetical protein
MQQDFNSEVRVYCLGIPELMSWKPDFNLGITVHGPETLMACDPALTQGNSLMHSNAQYTTGLAARF